MSHVPLGPLDPESIPDLTEVRRVAPEGPARGRAARRARRAEAAMIRVEAAAAHATHRGVTAPAPPLHAVEPRAVPHVRLGLLWAGATVLAAAGGQGWLALELAAVAAVAAAQLCRIARRAGGRPVTGAAVVVAGATPLLAWVAPEALAGVTTAAVVATLVAVTLRRPPGSPPSADAATTVLAGLAPASAALGPVLVAGNGTGEVLLLLALVFAFDVGSFLVDDGRSRWEPALVGAVCTLPVLLAVTALADASLSLGAVWLLGATAAAGAGAGRAAATVAVHGDGTAPALRRLDSVLLPGIVWAWAVPQLL